LATVECSAPQIMTNSSHHDTDGLAGHPKGMTTLFFTEMWERFSYYGMRALLVLYMVAVPGQGGLGFSMKDATGLYGVYTMMVYMGSIPGGMIADKILGARLSVLIGGIIIAAGHFSLAVKELPFFYAGLVLIVVGTGLLKPNISTMLGGLYDANDTRRDAGFSIFYMGINIGAAISPLVCGFLAQSVQFKGYLQSIGIDPNSSWHFGFAAAGVGMLLGLVQFVMHGKRLGDVGAKPQARSKEDKAQVVEPLSTDELKRLGAIGLLFFFEVLFWTVYEQGGTSLNLFADLLTRNEIFGMQFPSSWLQSVPAIFCIAMAPLFAAFWIKLGNKQPSSPAKFCYGLLFLSLGIGLMVPASMLSADGRVSPLWLCSSYFFQVVGEMCLSPVGLSTVTKLAPVRFASSTMGIWFLATAVASWIGGQLSGFFDAKATSTLVWLFGSMAGAGLVATLILFFLTPTIRKLMGKVH
jgi:POT family proton-dependent oligopeptide transporter